MKSAVLLMLLAMIATIALAQSDPDALRKAKIQTDSIKSLSGTGAPDAPNGINVSTAGSKVGIGTASPSASLDIENLSNTDEIRAFNTNFNSGWRSLYAGSMTQFQCANAALNAVVECGVDAQNFNIGRGNVAIIGSGGHNDSYPARLQVRGVTSDNSTTALQVEKADSTVIMSVVDDGKVGIGMVPTTPLSVKGTTGTPITHIQAYTAGSSFNVPEFLEFEEEDDATNRITGSIGAQGDYLSINALNGLSVLSAGAGFSNFITGQGASDGALKVTNSVDSAGSHGLVVQAQNVDPTTAVALFKTVAAESMRVTGDGKVGIGTQTPGQKLTVDGTLGILDASTNYHTILQGGTQSADVTYTLPPAAGISGQVMGTGAAGVLGWVNTGSASFFAPGTVAQVTQIVTVADTLCSLNNTYFNLYSAKDVTHYVVWINCAGTGTDPAIGGTSSLEVDTFLGDSAPNIAGDLITAFNGLGIDFVATAISNTVTIRNGGTGPLPDSEIYGASTHASDGAVSTGFTITTPTPGFDTDPTDPCAAGQLRYDTHFFYNCFATNSWNRSRTRTW